MLRSVDSDTSYLRLQSGRLLRVSGYRSEPGHVVQARQPIQAYRPGWLARLLTRLLTGGAL